jgi:hypothetical protein
MNSTIKSTKTMKSEELKNARTIIHDKVEGHLAMILNAAFGSNLVKNNDRRAMKVEKTSQSENDYYTHDLKVTYDDDRSDTVALIEIKTTRSKKRTLKAIVDSIFQHNEAQLWNTTQLALKHNSLWCFVIAIYRDNPLKIHQKFNEDDYNVLVMFGRNQQEYSYHYYYSFAQLEDTIRYYKTLFGWLSSDLVFRIAERSFFENPEWTTFPKSQLHNELKLTYEKPKKRKRKIVIDEDQANALRSFCSQKRQVKEVAEFLQVSTWTVTNWRKDPSNPNYEILIEVLGEVERRRSRAIQQAEKPKPKPKLSFFQRLKQLFFK